MSLSSLFSVFFITKKPMVNNAEKSNAMYIILCFVIQLKYVVS
jgi:hypothetical protein